MPTFSSRAAWRSSLILLAFALPLGVTRLARADVVCGDKTCPQNYECKDFPGACPAIACTGKDCPTTTCDTVVQECSPLPCSSDSDCADGMACHTQTVENCDTAPPCAAGQDCAATDTTCQPVTYSACVPQYVLPCQADADCGVGFTCVEEQDCACAGSSGSGTASSGSSGSSGGEPTPAADGGAAPDPADAGSADPALPPDPAPPPDQLPVPPSDGCTCTPSGTMACNLKVIACSVDQGCPTGWTCGENPNGVCFVSSDGTTGCSADPPLICLPPYYDLSVGIGRGADTSSTGTGTVGGGTAGAPSTGNPEPPAGNVGASTGGTTGSESGSTHAASSSSDSNDTGGCSVGRARGTFGAAFGFAALAFFGLLGARRRRTR